MNDTILTVERLSKNYGDNIALSNVSFELGKGESLGLLGRNGSGKTSLLSIISCVRNSSSGVFNWVNEVQNKLNKEKVGILLEAPAFYPTLNAVDNLKIVCLIKATGYAEINAILKDVGLFEKKHIKFKNYSLGMKQRLGIASALTGSPELLILDEPTNGLDPEGISLIRELIIRKKSEGVSVIMASHILGEVEKVCSKLVILDRGSLKYEGYTEKLLRSQNQLELVSDDLEKLYTALKDEKIILDIEKLDKFVLVTIPDSFTGTDVSKLLIDKKIILSGIQVREKSLEEEFLKLLQE